MTLLLTFAATLLVAVLVSEYASRSVVSTAVLFLAVGFVVGGPWGYLELEGGDDAVLFVAEIALFAVLFTDGMRVGARDLLRAWKLPGRALLLGMPLTLLITAGLAFWLAGLSWPLALLIGAALAPTDPVFASAIVGREEVPQRLRHLLNVESGLNDGLALPVVLLLLGTMGAEEAHVSELVMEILIGVGIGVAVPWLALRLEASRRLQAHAVYEPLLAFSAGLLVFAITAVTPANSFLAAYAAGITVSSVSEKARHDFHEFGEVTGELLKLLALLLFGVLIAPGFFAELTWGDWVFVAAALFVARPLAIAIALAGSGLGWRQKAVAAWFGPKGFASVVIGILILHSGIEGSHHLFHLLAVVIAASMVAHSSTDVLIAHWFRRQQQHHEELQGPRAAEE